MQTILVSYFSFVVYCNTHFCIRICWYRQSVACSFHPYMCGALSECAKAVYCELCIYFSSFVLPRHFTLLPTLFLSLSFSFDSLVHTIVLFGCGLFLFHLTSLFSITFCHSQKRFQFSSPQVVAHNKSLLARKVVLQYSKLKAESTNFTRNISIIEVYCPLSIYLHNINTISFLRMHCKFCQYFDITFNDILNNKHSKPTIKR